MIKKAQTIENQIVISLKKIRKEKGYTQQRIADLIDRKQPTYASWEEGKAIPPLPDLIKLAAVYETSIEMLLYGKNPHEYRSVEIVTPEIDSLDIDPVFKLELYREHVKELQMEIQHLNNKLRLREQLYNKLKEKIKIS